MLRNWYLGLSFTKICLKPHYHNHTRYSRIQIFYDSECNMGIYILKAIEQGNTMVAFIFLSEVTLKRTATVKLRARILHWLSVLLSQLRGFYL